FEDNPLIHEMYGTVIKGGVPVAVPAPDAFHLSSYIDNYHSSPQPVGTPNQSIDEPSILPLPQFGCPACVHVHWRWASLLNADGTLGSLIGVDPDFNSNGGKPFLPPGSNQDIDVAVEASGIEHPAPGPGRCDPSKVAAPEVCNLVF